jgi:predicted ATPase
MVELPPFVNRVSSLLPAPATTFIGRRDDLDAIAGWFTSGHRLVVIVGPPGMGKTRVAIEYAGALPADRAVRFCDVTEARDLDQLCDLVASCLGLSLESGSDVAAAIGLALRESGDLLVLDNFEQLVETAATTVAHWLSRAPRAQLLVTSRERLRIDGEVVHELEPLSLPAGMDHASSEAMQLFVDRARLLRRDYVLTPTDAPAVIEIVQRLDGIPLAIEVAVAHLAVMSPATLVERMPRRLDLLAGERRAATARQATLRGAIDGSWEALSPCSRAALAQVSIFRGGFTLEAAEAVVDLAGYTDAPAVVDVLSDLRAKSLLRCHDAAAGVRFSLYESIREYASERLAATTGAAAVRARHVRYFTERCAELGDRAHPHASSAHELFAERDNLTVALDGLLGGPVSAETTTLAARVLLAFDPVLPRSGATEAQLAWFDAVLARPPELLAPVLRANLLLARGRGLLARGRLDENLASSLVVVDIAHALQDPALEARALLGIAISHLRSRRDSDARAAFTRALELLGGSDPRRASVVHGYLGAIDQEAGRLLAARTHYREALRALEPIAPHDRAFLESTVRLRLAFLALDEGEPSGAELECEHVVALEVHARSRGLHGLAAGCLALARWSLDRLDEAEELITRSVRLLAEAGDQASEGFARSIRGAILAARDRADEATLAFAAAETALADAGEGVGLTVSAIYHGHLDLALARAAEAAGDPTRARVHRAEAERRSAPDGPNAHVVPARVARGTLQRALAATGDHDDPHALLVDHERRAMRLPNRARWVSFGRQAVAWRLLLELCEARLRTPGVSVAADVLIAAAWPGQTLLPTAAQNRLHVAMSSLRKLGLKALILTRDDGYLLPPELVVRWFANSKKT